MSQISSPFFPCLLSGSNKCIAIFSEEVCPDSKSNWSLLEEFKFYLWMRTSMCISWLDPWLEWELKSLSSHYWLLVFVNWLLVFVKPTQQICESIKISIPLSQCHSVFSAYQRWWQDLVWLLRSLCITALNRIYISIAPCMKDALHISLLLWLLWLFNLISCLFSPKNFLCFLKHDYWANTPTFSF